MAARPRSLTETEELQELKVRVVRLSELGAKLARPGTGDVAAETVPVRARPAPQPPQPPETVPAVPARARPAPQPPQPPETVPAVPARARPAPQPPNHRDRRRNYPARHPSRRRRPRSAPRPGGGTPAEAEPRRRLLSSGRLFFVLVTVLLYLGWSTQTERYINPNRGLGYALGIVAGA